MFQESPNSRIHGFSESLDIGKGTTRIINDSVKLKGEHTTIVSSEGFSNVVTSNIYELNNRISIIEKRILKIENMLNSIASKIEDLIKNQTNNLEKGIDRDNIELNLYTEALEIIKMCLQTILTNDLVALYSLVNELEHIIDRIKQKLKPKY
ncbi:MAG: hypothetical protein QXL96_00465 [Ignisphaera sp.]